jgi:hypothetical protein
MGRFSPTIGILCGGELRGEEAQTGDTRNELPSGRGNNGGFKEKPKGLESADPSLCAVVATIIRGGLVKLGVSKYFVVLGLCQGTAEGEMGVTRISPSNPRPRGENSAGTLLKFRKWETSEKGLLGR